MLSKRDQTESGAYGMTACEGLKQAVMTGSDRQPQETGAGANFFE